MAQTFRAVALVGALAATTIFAAPAMAADAPGIAAITSASGFDHSRYDPAAASADWRCRGWGCGYGPRRGWRRNRVDAGDVLLGAAIIGGIAAIASANNRPRQRDVVVVQRDPDWRQPDARRYDDRRTDRRPAVGGSGASGLDNAVNLCLGQIERDVRVDTVDGVERTGAGWRVSGTLFNGAPFQCRIGNGGQIDTIDYGDGFAAAPGGGAGQWNDQRYASARAAIGGAARPDMAVSETTVRAASGTPRAAAVMPMPAYPGGPIPGEVIPETIEGL